MTAPLQSDSIAELVPALVKAKAAFLPAVKGKVNPAFKSRYVDLEGVLDAVEPALLANGIALVHQSDVDDGQTVVFARLIHTSGEWIGARFPLRPVQNTPQAEGSALTYARRYTAMALCGIAPEDDDGQAATAGTVQRSQPPRQQRPAETRPAPAVRAVQSGEPAAEASPFGGGFENPAPLAELIATAPSITTLEGSVRQVLATAELRPDDRKRLREQYAAKKQELTS